MTSNSLKKNNGGTIRIKLEKGTFSSEYEDLKEKIRKIDKRCKKSKDDYILHLEDYKECYNKCLELEKMIEKVNNTETLLHSSKGSWLWTIIGWCLSIFASLWAGKYAVLYFTKLWEAAKTMLEAQ